MITKQYIKEFEKLGLGMFVHFGVYSVFEAGEWVKHLHGISDEVYAEAAKRFCPNTDWAEQLVKTAKNAGCRYITLTTRHHDGFSLYDVKGLNEYDSVHCCGRDLVREFVDACRAEGIIPFFYHTLLDWHEKSYDTDFKEYLKYLRSSVEILCTNYGKIGGIWFDGMWNKPEEDWEEDALYGMIRSHQPEAMIINNTGLSARGQLGHIELDSVTFERGKPQPINLEDSPKYVASEMCEIFGDHWGYAREDLHFKSPALMIEETADCRRYGANMLINVGPKGDGTLRAMDTATLEVLGIWMSYFDEAMRTPRPTSIEIEQKPKDFVLQDGQNYYLFCYDLPMSADNNVALEENGFYQDRFSFKPRVKRITWMDNGDTVDFEQTEAELTVHTVPYRYGRNLVVRVAKIETEARMFHSETKWIWLKAQEQRDEYASFLAEYTSNGGRIMLKLAAEIDYIAYVNGKRAAFRQFPGYRDQKYYDEIDITEASKEGKNELRIVVRYEGIGTSNHIADKAGVIFEVTEGEEVLCCSSEKTLGGLDTGYQQHVCRLVTGQLGYTTDMCAGGEISYDTCREADLSYQFKARPVKKLEEEPLVYGKKLDASGLELYDFDRETAGYVRLELTCEEACEVVLAYGEHIVDGCVRQKIDGRDFSMNFKCKKGKNVFENFFLRVAGRYIQIFKPQNAVVNGVAILPVMYPMKEKERFLTGLDAEIYDVCVRTLRLCMHEHYEDCPWREQALYVLDGRNQMLSGYYAFEDASFARANIVFMTKGLREDGLLELVFPSENTPVIPFFAVMYPVVVLEYIQHTGDRSILEEVMPTAKIIMETFRSMIEENGLLSNKQGRYWHFYEWSEGSAGRIPPIGEKASVQEKQYDLILNCAFVYSSKHYQQLCEMCGESFEVDLAAFKQAIKTFFYDEEKGMYFLSNKYRELYSQLGNAFAGLIGLDGRNLKAAIKGEGDVIPATLSMAAFVYDALLDGSEESEQFVLEDIRKKYGYMLECGATSFWETLEGEADFHYAGSLCHGWSAIPVYYYAKLLKQN